MSRKVFHSFIRPWRRKFTFIFVNWWRFSLW